MIYFFELLWTANCELWTTSYMNCEQWTMNCGLVDCANYCEQWQWTVDLWTVPTTVNNEQWTVDLWTVPTVLGQKSELEITVGGRSKSIIKKKWQRIKCIKNDSFITIWLRISHYAMMTYYETMTILFYDKINFIIDEPTSLTNSTYYFIDYIWISIQRLLLKKIFLIKKKNN